MKSIISLAIAAAMELTLFGCNDDLLRADHHNDFHPLPRLTDSLLLAISDPIYADTVIYDSLFFDMSGVPMGQSGDFNDIAIWYNPSFSEELPNWIYNCSTGQWDQFSYGTNSFGIFIGDYRHVLGARGLRMKDYVDESLGVIVRPTCALHPPCHPWVSQGYLINLLKLHPYYHPTPIVDSLNRQIGNMAYDGENYLLGIEHIGFGWLYSVDGVCRDSIALPSPVIDLSSDMGEIWMIGSDSNIYKIGSSGEVISSFAFPFGIADHIAVSGNTIFLLRFQYGIKIYIIDKLLSITTGQAAMTDSLVLEGTVSGFALDGQHLLIGTSDHLIRYEMDGNEIERYIWPVDNFRDMIVEGGVLHLLCGGPKILRPSDHVIARFRLP